MRDSGPMVADAYRFAPAAPDEDVVYGACSPGWHSAGTHEQAVDRWIDFMHDAGVQRVCCLLAGRQLDDEGGNLARYQDAFGARNVTHVPVPVQRLADVDTLQTEVLPFLEDAEAAGEQVVVHCLSGLGRTGYVLAAWLVHDRGDDPEAAVQTVQSMGRDPFEPVDHGNATREEVLALLGKLA